jgi:hypothetical protein
MTGVSANTTEWQVKFTTRELDGWHSEPTIRALRTLAITHATRQSRSVRRGPRQKPMPLFSKG